MELNTAHAMVANRDETIAQLKQAAQDALIVNDSAVAESCALMELLRKGDWTAAGSSDTPMDDDTSKLGLGTSAGRLGSVSCLECLCTCLVFPCVVVYAQSWSISVTWRS